VCILAGFDAISSLIADRALRRGESMALRDYYPYWSSQQVVAFAFLLSESWPHLANPTNVHALTITLRLAQESDESGKVLLLDLQDRSIHPIFFDDNVEHTRKHIVDVREQGSGRGVPFEASRGRYLVKAEPWLAITDPAFFIDRVRACEDDRHQQTADSRQETGDSRQQTGNSW
jgi:hypothetical protein